MERRHFLRYALVAALPAPLLGCGNRHARADRTLQLPQVLSQLTDEATVRRIGKAYRAQVPTEANQETLTDRLLEGSPAALVIRSFGKSMLGPLLDHKIRRDFKEGRIVVLEGWLLSQTEARQCALYSLVTV
ncbi:hypothetical protein GCM10023189_46180 [Nibrella saemangeumensis]|uniref:Uncharacterized protein n=1 Tax=Nibrella saemangeumensis TaxID=1084526 RepID=A0ABP8NDH0_9BACT